MNYRFLPPGLRVCSTTLILLAGLAALASTAQAAFPGGNGKIAFTSYRDGNAEIYTMNADGTNQVRLTNDAARDDYPVWSPDGTRLAFTSQRDGNAEIYVMNADGLNPTRLTTNAAVDELPAWSPDGTGLAFNSSRDGNYEIFVMGADGSAQFNVSNNTETDDAPAWSPDGTRIAFASFRDGNFEIYVMDANGSNQTRLTTNSSADRFPAWSPDGTQIAFLSERDQDIAIYRMNADGSNPTRLSNSSAFDRQPAWSSDGARIAFESLREGNLEIYVMNADGSAQSNVSNSPDADIEPDWQPVAPANDAQGQARVIGEGQFAGALALATPDGTASCPGFGGPDPDIWYRYTLPIAGTVRASTCGTHDLASLDTGTDTVLSLHTASGLAELACNDDWPISANPAVCAASDSGSRRDSYAEAYLPAGQDVLIRVGRYPNGGPTRAVVLNLSFSPDSDGDGILDGADNCTLRANPSQCDSDSDGYGNRCDGDLSNNEFTNAQDTTLFRQQLGQPSAPPTYNAADLNCNGFVNAQDATLFRGLLGSPPGPSDLVP